MLGTGWEADDRQGNGAGVEICANVSRNQAGRPNAVRRSGDENRYHR